MNPKLKMMYRGDRITNLGAELGESARIFREAKFRKESLNKRQVTYQIERHKMDYPYLDPSEFFEEIGIKESYTGDTLLNWLGYRDDCLGY